MGGTLRKLVVIWLAGFPALALIGCGGASAATPQRVADQIRQNDSALHQAIDAWRVAGDPPSSPTPPDVAEHAGELQDLVAFLGDHPNLAIRVIPLLDGGLRGEITRLYGARRALLRLSAGSKHKKLKLGQRPPLADLVGFYDEAERRFGIGANYLAAIHLVETKFGRVVSNSVAGAQGPMQFIPIDLEYLRARRQHPRSARRNPRRGTPAASEWGAGPVRPRASRLQPVRALRERGHPLREGNRAQPLRALLPLRLGALGDPRRESQPPRMPSRSPPSGARGTSVITLTRCRPQARWRHPPQLQLRCSTRQP